MFVNCYSVRRQLDRPSSLVTAHKRHAVSTLGTNPTSEDSIGMSQTAEANEARAAPERCSVTGDDGTRSVVVMPRC
jgi:hypothetical protein